MPTTNSLASVINQQNNGQSLSLSFAGTTGHAPFLLNNGVVAMAQLLNGVNAIPQNAVMPLFSGIISSNGNIPWTSARQSTVAFIVRAAGLYPAAGIGFQIDLCLGSALTPVICSTGAFSNSTAKPDNWNLTAKLLYDVRSTNLRGTFSGNVGGTIISPGIVNLTNPASMSALSFSVAVTCLNQNPASIFQLTELSADLL